MAITQTSKIQIRSGKLQDLPQLAVGEMAYATDANQLFIGNDSTSSWLVPTNTEILTVFSNIPASGSNQEVMFNNSDLMSGANATNPNAVFKYNYLGGSDGNGLLTVNNINVINDLTINSEILGKFDLSSNRTFIKNSSTGPTNITIVPNSVNEASAIRLYSSSNISNATSLSVGVDDIGAFIGTGRSGGANSVDLRFTTVGNADITLTPHGTGVVNMPRLIASNATFGDLISSGNSNLGSINNITITGGVSGQVLTTDGSGSLSFSSPAVSAPATSSSIGTPGQIAYDSGFIYVCVAVNTWQRAALSSF